MSMTSQYDLLLNDKTNHALNKEDKYLLLNAIRAINFLFLQKLDIFILNLNHFL